MKSVLITLALALLLSCAIVVYAQPPDTLWTQTYGGSGYDQCNDIKQTVDSGYIMTGYTGSFGAGNLDVFLIKTDSLGDTLWTQTYGGIYGDEGNSVQQTIDGGYIIVGETFSFGLSCPRVYLIKTNSLGDTLWTRIYGGDFYSIGNSVQQSTDGGYIIVGRIYSYSAGYEVYLIKTNSLGDTLWTKTYGGSDYDKGNSVQQTTDGGYIITGRTDSYGAGSSDIYLIKTDSLGDTLWTKTYGGSGNDAGNCVQQTSDGGYVVVGNTHSYSYGHEVYLIKTNSLGDTLWTKTYSGNGVATGNCVQQTSDNGYIITGDTYFYNLGTKVLLIKTNSLGDTLWTNTYGESGNDAGNCVQQTSDGGYVVAGHTYSYGVGKEFYLIRLGTETTGVEPFQTAIPLEFTLYPAYPNPFNLTTNINYALPVAGNVTLTVYDINGRQVATLVDGYRDVGQYEFTFDATELTSGVYFCRIKAGDYSATKKMMLVK